MENRPMEERFIIELEPLPSWHDVPPVYRLRGLLKAALRAHGLRCVSAENVKADEHRGGKVIIDENEK